MTFVVDTHPLVWFLEGNKRLSKKAEEALADAEASFVVPSIVLAEITFLYAKGRIPIAPGAVLRHLSAVRNCAIYPLDEAVIERLPITLEIHDAIIVATALVFRDVLGHPTTVITRDEQITDSGLVDVLW